MGLHSLRRKRSGERRMGERRGPNTYSIPFSYALLQVKESRPDTQ